MSISGWIKKQINSIRKRWKTWFEEEVPPMKPPVEPPKPEPEPEPPVPDDSLFPKDLKTNSRDGDPRRLEETITEARLSWNGRYFTIHTPYDRKWKAVNTEGGVNANVWVMATRNGETFATTWEWMRPGSWSKDGSKCRPDHAKSSVMPNDFRLKAGDYLFASTIVRHPKHKNGSERTNLLRVSKDM